MDKIYSQLESLIKFLSQSLDKDVLSLSITVISILLWFVISISSYLVSTSMPNIESWSIKNDDDSIDILQDLWDLIEIKEVFSKYLLYIHIGVFSILLLILIIQNKFTFLLFIFLSSTMFILCSYKIAKIIKLNLSISNASKNILMRKYQEQVRESKKT